MVIDQEGIIRYSQSGVNVSAIQSSINSLLATAIEEPASIAQRFELGGNYPNPFNPVTTIPFALDRGQKINLKIYDAGGRLIRRLIDGEYGAGRHSARWNGLQDNGAPAASGIYFYRLTGPDQQFTRRMILLK